MTIDPRLRRTLTATAIILVIALLAGATYQGVATALERRQYPHPGRLVDVGGHQLHIYCTGEPANRQPAIVLEAPEGGMSAEWSRVQAALSVHYRVCSYDRAGLGWSEAGDRPYDPGRVPEELHALLRNAGVAGPYVLVGQSLGAAFARVYAARYPGEVAGLVAVDAPPDRPRAGRVRLMTLSPWLARAGVLRASGLLAGRADGLPARDAGALRSFLNRPDHLTRASRELARWQQALRLADEAVLAPNLAVASVPLLPRRLADEQSAVEIVEAVRTLTKSRPGPAARVQQETHRLLCLSPSFSSSASVSG